MRYVILLSILIMIFAATPTEYMAKLKSELKTPEPPNMSVKQAGAKYGEIKSITYFSTSANKNKKAKVILPPEYDSSQKYPVMYVNHGIFGDENSMVGTDMGVVTISANLALAGEAKKMIIVSTSMFTSKTMDAPAMGGFTNEVTAAYDAFLDDLTKDLMPYMEKNFPILTGRENTAITGFSMGGREALYIGISRPDLFGYIGGACPAPGIVPAVDMFMTHNGSMKESEFKIKDEKNYPWVILISGATNDPVVGTFPKQYSELLTKNGCNHVYQDVPMGSHDGVSVRAHLYNFVKFAFKGSD